MLNVGIRELKDHLSSYIKKVKRGEIVTITERGKAVAEIISLEKEDLKKRLTELVREGDLYWGGGDKPRGLKNPPKIKGKTIAKMVLEDRR